MARSLPMDGLSSIKPEIEQFVSRENRRHGDAWLQQVQWEEPERTLTLYVRKPPPAGCDVLDNQGLQLTLICPNVMRIYFPASLDEKPFCFAEEDVLVPAAEAANGKLKPLSRNSVLSVVTTILKCIKREMPDTPRRTNRHPPGLSSGVTGQGASVKARVSAAAAAVMSAIKEDPLGADLALALLSMAVSSYRRDTVAAPFPKQLESQNKQRQYGAFIASLEDIPSMREISQWTNCTRLLNLPPVALVALHFVLVYLPTKLRKSTRSQIGSSSATIAPTNSIDASDKAGLGQSTIINPSGVSTRQGGGDSAGTWDANGGKKNLNFLLGDIPSYVFEVVLPADPAFEVEALHNGSKVAYHGSSPENFHSILNTGLRVMTDTRLMKNGALFGMGIYLSASLAAAASFSLRGDGNGTTVWGRSAFGDPKHVNPPTAPCLSGSPPRQFQHRLVVKCRVLIGDGVKEVEGWGDEESYFVVSDASKIRIEALLLFDEGQSMTMEQPVDNPPNPSIETSASSACAVSAKSDKPLAETATANNQESVTSSVGVSSDSTQVGHDTATSPNVIRRRAVVTSRDSSADDAVPRDRGGQNNQSKTVESNDSPSERMRESNRDGYPWGQSILLFGGFIGMIMLLSIMLPLEHARKTGAGPN